MMVVDSSAIVAVVKKEPGHERILARAANMRSVMGAPSIVEIKMVLSRLVSDSLADAAIRGLTSDLHIEPVDFTPAMADAAVAAFRAYGKGRGHPAQLNFGDCMAYGVAKVLDLPLLYKGEDFALTDIRPALA